MKLKLENIVLYFGWTLTIIIAIYLILKIFRVIHSPTLEEIILGTLISYSMVLGVHQTKIINIEKDLTKVIHGLIKIEKKLNSTEAKINKINVILRTHEYYLKEIITMADEVTNFIESH